MAIGKVLILIGVICIAAGLFFMAREPLIKSKIQKS